MTNQRWIIPFIIPSYKFTQLIWICIRVLSMQAQKYFPPKREHSSKRFVTHIRYLIETCRLTSTILTQKKTVSILLLIIRKHLLSCPILVQTCQSVSKYFIHTWLKIEYSFPYLYHIGNADLGEVYRYMISEEILRNQTLRYK